MKQIKAVLWDIAGIFYSDDFQPLQIDLSKRLGVPEKDMLSLMQAYIPEGHLRTGAFDELIQTIRTRFNVEANIKKIFLETFTDHIHLRPEMISLLSRLRNFATMAALTNVTESRDQFDQSINLYRHFDHAFLSYRLGMKKPDPRFFQYALNTLNMQPTECLFIDDAERNVAAANTLGIHGILYDQNFDKLQETIRKFNLPA